MKKQKICKSVIGFVLTMICIVIVLTTSAFAGTSKSNFNVDVPKLGKVFCCSNLYCYCIYN